MLKRAFDILSSGTAIMVLSPILVPICIVLRLTGEGEVFYRQERIGKGGKPFKILKFATMLKNSPNMAGGDITVGRDPRILPMGGFLRASKINELPQLLNIFRGEMSVIGPRPLTPRIAAMFPADHWQALSNIKPGLSGIGSVIFRDEETLLDGVSDRNAVYQSAIVPYKSALERWYALHQSLGTDLLLITLTIAAILHLRLDPHRVFSDLPPRPQPLKDLMARNAGVVSAR
jgi:lipopolysaccharide/colanic/teichoic acid biosynthesis glycosyltransferase